MSAMDKRFGCHVLLAVIAVAILSPCFILAIGWIALAAGGILRENAEAASSDKGDEDDELQQGSAADRGGR